MTIRTCPCGYQWDDRFPALRNHNHYSNESALLQEVDNAVERDIQERSEES